ncbi:MAG: Protein of unknown function transrane [Acidobacteriaceae bacterium]|nr:Protein of unknown function transrane [Acidobacteriaceae bacterium]
MSDGSEEQPPQDARSNGSKELAELSARVTALEHQIESLNAVLAADPDGRMRIEAKTRPDVQSPVLQTGESAAPPPIPSASVAAAAGAPPRKSLENRLGSQVFSRVGILVVLIGAALFLKLAIDNQWIGPTGRVLAGLGAGAGLVVWSERFRRKGFSAFSYTLKAVGSGVLYLALWAGFQLYHLLPDWAALTAMLLVTAWNAYMAWAQDAEMLAAYALIGGCATPLLLSSGGNHETFLFTYLLVLDVAIIALVRLRPWPRLLMGVFPSTMSYFIGWYAKFYTADQFSLTAVFIVLFFVAFASVPLGRALALEPESTEAKPGLKPSRASILTEILLPLANAAFGSLAFYSALQDSGRHGAQPWMVLVFAAVYLGIMRLPQSAAASAVHLSLAIVFITIAIPLKVSGHWITVSWLVEGAVLLWVAVRLVSAGSAQDRSPVAGYRVLRALGVGALSLGFAGVMYGIYDYKFVDPAFFNHRYGTALVGIAAFAAAVWIAQGARRTLVGDTSKDAQNEQCSWLQIEGSSIVAISLIAILATVQEIESLWRHTSANPEADLQQALAVSAFLMVYGGALLAVGFWKRSAFVRWQALLLIVYTIAKTFVYDMRNLSQGYRVASFMALGVLLLGVSFAYQNDWLALREKPAPDEDAVHAEESR